MGMFKLMFVMNLLGEAMRQAKQLVMIFGVILFMAIHAHAGSIEPPTTGPPESTMHTLDDIYNKIDSIAILEKSFPAKTGQALCYDSSGNVIPCSGTGQDGEYQKGISSPNPRFTDNGDGTVTDNLTGLIWLKNAYTAGAQRDWPTALSDIDQLNTDGTMNGNDCGDTSNGGSHQTDWRLSNVKELQSLIDFNQHDPSLSFGHPFLNVQFADYWSATTYVYYNDNAWYVNMNRGSVRIGEKISTTYLRCVWSVRGGND